MSGNSTWSSNSTGLIRTTASGSASHHPTLNPFFISIIAIVGAVGNLLICTAILLDKRLQSVTNYYLFSLSIADFLMSVVIIPLRYLMLFNELDPSIDFLCHFYRAGDHILLTSSSLHICTISLERYFAIKDPLGRVRPSTSSLAVRIFLLWLASCMLIATPLGVTIVVRGPKGNGHYHCGNLEYFQLVAITQIAIILLAVAIVFYTFIRTVVILRDLGNEQRHRRTGSRNGIIRSIPTITTSSNRPMLDDTEKRALVVVWLLSFAFIIAVLPLTIVLLIHVIIASYMYHIYTVTDPIIYVIFIKRFRDNFKNILLFKFVTSKCRK